MIFSGFNSPSLGLINLISFDHVFCISSLAAGKPYRRFVRFLCFQAVILLLARADLVCVVLKIHSICIQIMLWDEMGGIDAGKPFCLPRLVLQLLETTEKIVSCGTKCVWS